MASKKSRVVWALLVWGAFLSITTMQITSAAAKPPDGKGGGGKGGAPPAAVTDLAVTGVTHDSITLEWTASGNSGTEGTAAAYEIRYLVDEPIDDANWDFANLTYIEPAPQVSGSAESFTIFRLSGNQVYDIALKVINDKGGASDLSNPVTATTAIAAPGEWDPSLATQTTRSDKGDFDFDPDGHPSVVFLEGYNNYLWFSHFDGAVWNQEIMIADIGLPSVGLQYDPSGRPTVTFSGYGTTGIFFGYRSTNDGWFFETIDSGNVDGSGSNNIRPVYDSAGNPSVVYQIRNETKGKNKDVFYSLHYAVRVGGVWQRETLDVSVASTGFVMMPSLVYNLGGNAVVAYRYKRIDDVFELRLAVRTGSGSWVKETFAPFPTAEAISNPSLAIDPITGMPMIAFRVRMIRSTPSVYRLHAALFNGVSWQVELVDSFAAYANNPNLLFDATSAPVIAYRSSRPVYEVLLARFNGESWDIEAVDSHPASNRVRLRIDALGIEAVLFGVGHAVNGTPNEDELFLTRRVGN